MSARPVVAGIGGIFFKAQDPKALALWYRDHLGIPVDEGATYGTFATPAAGDAAGPLQTVWSTMPASTKYFEPSSATFMVNYRVAELDALLASLRGAGVTVDDKVEDTEFGKFGWAIDPEGNRFELWQPPAGGM